MAGLTADRTQNILQAANASRVLVVGDLMLDRYISGAVDRISPEAPVPVVRVEGESFAVGGAANVAANVAALGARCTVVGVVGRDEAGERLRHELESLGVRTDGLVPTENRYVCSGQRHRDVVVSAMPTLAVNVISFPE